MSHLQENHMNTTSISLSQQPDADLGAIACAEFAEPVSASASETVNLKIEAACQEACQAIAPAWPLDRAIAVNPHWSRIQRPVREVAARMAVLGDIRVFPSRSYIRQAWHEGRISQADLSYALNALSAAGVQALSAAQCIDALASETSAHRLPLLIDVLDDDLARHTRLSWRQAITHQVSEDSGSLNRLLAGVQLPCGLERLHLDDEDETMSMAFVTAEAEPRIIAVSLVDELERLGMEVEPLSYTEARAHRDGFELAVTIYLEPRRVIRDRRTAFPKAPTDSVVVEFTMV